MSTPSVVCASFSQFIVQHSIKAVNMLLACIACSEQFANASSHYFAHQSVAQYRALRRQSNTRQREFEWPAAAIASYSGIQCCRGHAGAFATTV
ncbi:hypothetical protein OK016_17275 [Vibrio chagasii]|nr:hypothetical protein [Vibrio chagasii]